MKLPWVGIGRVVLTAALAAGVVAASDRIDRTVSLAGSDTPRATQSARATSPTSALVTCPGPELLGLKDVPDTAQTLTVIGARAPGAAYATDPGTDGSLTLTSGAEVSRVEGLIGSRTVTTPSPVLVQGSGGRAPGISGSQAWTADTKDLRGLVTTSCPAEGDDLWLIGGGGAPGRQERLVLANSGANEVSVDVVVHGEKGPVVAPNGRGVVVPGRGRTAVLLDAIAAGEAAPAVHVTVRGGAVTAILSDVWLDGSVAAGAETTTPVVPSTKQVMPGVRLSQPGFVRVAVAGQAQAVVSVRVVTPSGAAPLPGGGVTRVAGGSTLDIPLADLPAGTYAVEAVADVPIVAAAFTQVRSGSDPGDFAWSVATPALAGLAGVPFVALGPDAGRALDLLSSGADSEVVIWSGDPAQAPRRAVTLPADRVVSVELPASEGGVWLQRTGGSGEVHGAVVSTTGTDAARLISVMPLGDTVTASTTRATYPLP